MCMCVCVVLCMCVRVCMCVCVLCCVYVYVCVCVCACMRACVCIYDATAADRYWKNNRYRCQKHCTSPFCGERKTNGEVDQRKGTATTHHSLQGSNVNIMCWYRTAARITVEEEANPGGCHYQTAPLTLWWGLQSHGVWVGPQPHSVNSEAGRSHQKVCVQL